MWVRSTACLLRVHACSPAQQVLAAQGCIPRHQSFTSSHHMKILATQTQTCTLPIKASHAVTLETYPSASPPPVGVRTALPRQWWLGWLELGWSPLQQHGSLSDQRTCPSLPLLLHLPRDVRRLPTARHPRNARAACARQGPIHGLSSRGSRRSRGHGEVDSWHKALVSACCLSCQQGLRTQHVFTSTVGAGSTAATTKIWSAHSAAVTVHWHLTLPRRRPPLFPRPIRL